MFRFSFATFISGASFAIAMMNGLTGLAQTEGRKDPKQNKIDCVRSDETTGHRFTANCEGWDYVSFGQPVQFRTNSQGLRDPEYPAKPSPGRLRVLFLGPSVTLNISGDQGIVPGVRRALERAARDRRFPGYRTVEVISAGQAGYDTVQSALHLPELLAAYSPHWVVFFDNFLGMPLSEYHSHDRAPKDPATGLARVVGRHPAFWPLPISWEPRIWPNAWAPQARVFSQAARLALLKYKLRFFSSGCGERGASCVVATHRRYVESMHAAANARGARFTALWPSTLLSIYVSDTKSGFNHGISAWYKPEWVASLVAPWDHFPLSAVEEFRKSYATASFESIDIGPEFKRAMRGSQMDKPEQYHLTETHATWLGERIGEHLIASPPRSP